MDELIFPCPRCGTDSGLLKTDQASVPHFICPHCEGAAWSFAAIKQLASSPAVEAFRHAATHPHETGGLNCSFCAKKMVRVQPLAGPPVDVCSTCSTIWLDSGELEELRRAITLPPAPPAGKACNAVRELAMLEADLVAERERNKSVNDPPTEWWKWVLGAFLLPVEINPATVRTPVMTHFLTVVIGAFSLWGFLVGGNVYAEWGFRSTDPWRNGGLTLITSVLLHAGVIHLLGNLYFLYVFGKYVEDIVGPRLFLGLFVVAALAGHCVHLMIRPESSMPGVGASGAVAGVLVFFLFSVTGRRFGIFSFNFYCPGWVMFPGGFFIFLWLAIQLLGALVMIEYDMPIGYDVHIGGAIAGFISVMTWRMWKRRDA